MHDARRRPMGAGHDFVAAQVRRTEHCVPLQLIGRLQLHERGQGRPLEPPCALGRQRAVEDPREVSGHSHNSRCGLRRHGLDEIFLGRQPFDHLHRSGYHAVLPRPELQEVSEVAIRADGLVEPDRRRGAAAGLRPRIGQGPVQPHDLARRRQRVEEGHQHQAQILVDSRPRGLRQHRVGAADRQAPPLHSLRLQQTAVLLALPRDGRPTDQRRGVLRAVRNFPGGRHTVAAPHRQAAAPIAGRRPCRILAHRGGGLD
mmetsp:Transcript_88289/g.270166  ORF Transcript_88289/g.270166 Transcript_88289/m.270166 type:complete len:258 (+) Transcript_88289:918-1691(+)